MEPLEIRRGAERTTAMLAGREAVRDSKGWALYSELIASGAAVLEHAVAVERLGGGSEKVAWAHLVQLEWLGLISRDRPGGPWAVHPPASPEARKWVADSMAGGSHQRRSSGPPG